MMKRLFLFSILITSIMMSGTLGAIDIGKSTTEEFSPYMSFELELEHEFGMLAEGIVAPVEKGTIKDFDTEDVKEAYDHTLEAKFGFTGYLSPYAEFNLNFKFKLMFDYEDSFRDNDDGRPELIKDSKLYGYNKESIVGINGRKDDIGYIIDFYGMNMRVNLDKVMETESLSESSYITAGFFEFEPGTEFFTIYQKVAGLHVESQTTFSVPDMFVKLVVGASVGQHDMTFAKPNGAVGFNIAVILSPMYDKEKGEPELDCCSVASSTGNVFEIGMGLSYFEEKAIELERVGSYAKSVVSSTETISTEPGGESSQVSSSTYLVKNYMEMIGYFRMGYENHFLETSVIVEIPGVEDSKVGTGFTIGVAYGYNIIEGMISGFLVGSVSLPMVGTPELYKLVGGLEEEPKETGYITNKTGFKFYIYPLSSSSIEVIVDLGYDLSLYGVGSIGDDLDGTLSISPYFDTEISFKI